jgi:hypothetical protein
MVAAPALARSAESRQHDRMAASNRTIRALAGVVLALALGAGTALTATGSPATNRSLEADLALPAWTGGIDLYRSGAFSTQRSWLWCTAAGVQIVSNIVDRERDHSTSAQRRYFEWMRRHNRYDLPLSAGVDPQGWTAGLRHFVDGRYRLVASRTFDGALRSAVERMRRTNLPVALTVSHGNHGWILTGFRATADPARTKDFTVTSVRVSGPLYPIQTRGGYDMPPNTRLTTAQLRRFFTPWRYDPKPMIWDGRYVSIQPVPVAKPAVAKPTARPTARPTPRPTAAPTTAPSPSPSAAIATPLPSASAGPIAVVVDPPVPSQAVDPASDAPPAAVTGSLDPESAAVAGGVAVVVLVSLGALVVGLRRRPTAA